MKEERKVKGGFLPIVEYWVSTGKCGRHDRIEKLSFYSQHSQDYVQAKIINES